MVFPTHGHRGVTPSIFSLGYVFSWRRLILATPSFGDCSSWAMSLLGDASLGRCLSWAMSDHLIFHYLTRWWHTKWPQPIMYAAERHFHKRRLYFLLQHPPFSCPRHHTRWPDRYTSPLVLSCDLSSEKTKKLKFWRPTWLCVLTPTLFTDLTFHQPLGSFDTWTYQQTIIHCRLCFSQRSKLFETLKHFAPLHCFIIFFLTPNSQNASANTSTPSITILLNALLIITM